MPRPSPPRSSRSRPGIRGAGSISSANRAGPGDRRALESLPAAAVGAGHPPRALSPTYDLSKALAGQREMVVFWSPLDLIVLGAGTRIFGTIDRVRTAIRPGSSASGRPGRGISAAAGLREAPGRSAGTRRWPPPTLARRPRPDALVPPEIRDPAARRPRRRLRGPGDRAGPAPPPAVGLKARSGAVEGDQSWPVGAFLLQGIAGDRPIHPRIPVSDPAGFAVSGREMPFFDEASSGGIES